MGTKIDEIGLEGGAGRFVASPGAVFIRTGNGLEAAQTALAVILSGCSPLAAEKRFMDGKKDTSPFGHYAPHGLCARLIAQTRAAGPSWASRRWSFLLRRIALRLLRGAPVDIETYGARMRLFPYNNVSEKRILFTPQFFDAEERALLEGQISDDFVFIDIGANIGGYSMFTAAHAKGRCRVLAIEPQPDIFERLIFNIRQNAFSSVKALECAVTDSDGEITLFVDKQNQGETSVRVVSAEGGRSVLRVPAKTLLTIVSEEGYDHIDAMKLDVEGAEDLIIEPFFRTAPHALWPKLIIMEHLHQRWAVDLPKLLENNGYTVVQRTRNNAAWMRVDR